jgi:hypothetical protein
MGGVMFGIFLAIVGMCLVIIMVTGVALGGLSLVPEFLEAFDKAKAAIRKRRGEAEGVS